MSYERIAETASHMPVDFPSAEYEKIRELFVSKYAITHRSQRRLFGEGWNGLLFRYRAMNEYHEEFTTSIKHHGNSPPFEERYKQEKTLFGFFVSSISAIECFFYSNYFVGAVLKPDEFPIDSESLRLVKPRCLVKMFKANFPKEALTGKMKKCVDDTMCIEMTNMRDVLSHRGALAHNIDGEKVAIPSNPKATSDQRRWDFPINEGTTANHRQWVSDTIRDLISAMHEFCLKHFLGNTLL